MELTHTDDIVVIALPARVGNVIFDALLRIFYEATIVDADDILRIVVRHLDTGEFVPITWQEFQQL